MLCEGGGRGRGAGGWGGEQEHCGGGRPLQPGLSLPPGPGRLGRPEDVTEDLPRHEASAARSRSRGHIQVR